MLGYYRRNVNIDKVLIFNINLFRYKIIFWFQRKNTTFITLTSIFRKIARIVHQCFQIYERNIAKNLYRIF